MFALFTFLSTKALANDQNCSHTDKQGLCCVSWGGGEVFEMSVI